jgi:hypothetical protein
VDGLVDPDSSLASAGLLVVMGYSWSWDRDLARSYLGKLLILVTLSLEAPEMRGSILHIVLFSVDDLRFLKALLLILISARGHRVVVRGFEDTFRQVGLVRAHLELFLGQFLLKRLNLG